MHTTTKIILAAAIAASGFGIIQMIDATHAGATPVHATHGERGPTAKHVALGISTTELRETLQR